MVFTVFNGELGQEGQVFVLVNTANKSENLLIDLTQPSDLKSSYEKLISLMNNNMIFTIDNYSTEIEFCLVAIRTLNMDTLALDYTTMSIEDKKIVDDFKEQVLKTIK